MSKTQDSEKEKEPHRLTNLMAYLFNIQDIFFN